MITHRHTTKWIALVMAVAVCLCLAAVACPEQIKALAGETGVSMEYETALFNTDEVMQVNILMDSDDWDEMLENAMEEEYYSCNVEVNGKTFYNVGIRPKGNTSLSSIANDPTTDRYSFKLEFDHYVEGQTCYGLDKLILNNNYADATSMKEALIYDMFQYLGADASLYNYASTASTGAVIWPWRAWRTASCFGITERQRENSTSRKAWRWGTEVAVLSPEAAVRI